MEIRFKNDELSKFKDKYLLDIDWQNKGYSECRYLSEEAASELNESSFTSKEDYDDWLAAIKDPEDYFDTSGYVRMTFQDGSIQDARFVSLSFVPKDEINTVFFIDLG